MGLFFDSNTYLSHWIHLIHEINKIFGQLRLPNYKHPQRRKIYAYCGYSKEYAIGFQNVSRNVCVMESEPDLMDSFPRLPQYVKGNNDSYLDA